jgi:eukaryotic-like serine/threonine-protein kinase
MIGAVLGNYRVEAKLGEGGMGEVWLATDVRLGRHVALKFLSDEVTRDAARVFRFEREARAASALNHPNVCTIFGLGETTDRERYIAMEYVDGVTLRERLAAPLRVADALDIAIQVASALSAAHAAGIVHRDIKPENVMIRPDGLVKVLDFGLAKLAIPAEEQDARPTETLLATRVGTVVGTAGYMSPEQAEGKVVDGRSDVFAFGALLYEMTAGHPAFRADSMVATLAAILHKDPAPLPTALPPELKALVFRCLRKRPEDRYQDVQDVRIALEEIRDAVGGHRSGPMLTSRATRAIPAAAIWMLVGVAVIAVAVWGFRDARVANEPAYEVVPLTSDAGFEGAPSFSPDGSLVAYSWNGPSQDNYDIYVKQIGAPKPLRLTSHPAEDRFPAFSPDGQSIGFFRVANGRATYIVTPAVGGSERTVADVPAVSAGLTPIAVSWPSAWLPNGRSVVLDGLRVLSLDTGALSDLRDPSGKPVAGWFPTLSSDGRTLGFCRPSTSFAEYRLYTIDLTNEGIPRGDPEKLIDLEGEVYGLAWTANGRQLVFSSGPLSGASGLLKALSRVTARKGAVPEPLPFGGDVTLPAISRQGSRLAFVRNTWEPDIYRARLPESGTPAPPAERFVSSTRSDWNPQYSPDGRHLAFESNRTGQSAVWMSDADGSNLVEVFSRAGRHSGTPRWSPDSQRLAFDSSAEGSFDIYVIRPGSREPVRLTADPADDAIPSWSPDGQWIYFMSNRSGRRDVWRVAATGGAAVQITRNGGVCAHTSADGTQIYYTKGDGDSTLWTMPVSGGPERLVLPSVMNRAFVVFREGLYFIPHADAQGRFAVHYLDLSTGRITPVSPIAGPANIGLSVSPDGRYVLYSQTNTGDSDLMLVEGFR